MSKKATIIAVVNQKGGTGKTTTTENLGVGLALEGKKVLLVDTDPQASLTVSLGNPCPDDLSPTLSDLMGKIMMENPKEVLMQRNSTIGELMERKRIQDGAKEYQGHTYMDLARFDDATKHMIIFDVLTDESPVGWKGERNRLYLSDVGYQKALDNQKAGNIKIISHAAVAKGNLYYDHRDMAR